MISSLTIKQALPKRFRLENREIDWAHYQHAKKTKRQLLKETFEGWKLLHEPKPRGWKTPPIETAIHFVHALAPVLKIAKEAVNKGSPISDRELAQKLSEALNVMPHDSSQPKPQQ